MPAGPGESLLTTLFADIHYYFNDPSSKPQHHRFDRGSYVYLFNNASENRAKLEIANHAGTPDQDAFSGYLNAANIRYSHKQPNLFTCVIDGASLQGHDQWHLPSFNERNEQKYLYKINTLDIYFWTEDDAGTFLGHLRSILPPSKLDIKDAPSNIENPVEHKDSMSPVVQQLERTAINPQFTPERKESAVSQHSNPGSPPLGSPAPMAYNPAAPAAPEPIAHREKTPPPPDAEAPAAPGRYDPYSSVPNTFGGSNQFSGQPSYFTGPPQQHSATASFPGPPSTSSPPAAQRPQSGSFRPLPPGAAPQGQQYPPSFSPPPTQQTQQQIQHFAPSPPPSSGRTNSFGAPVQQYLSNPQQRAPSFGPNAVASPGLPGAQSPHPPPPPSAAHSQPNQPPYGYSNYNYSAAQQSPQYGSGGYSGDIHNVAYRPTADETSSHAHRPSQSSQRQGSESRQRLEDTVGKAEARIGKFLKKLDKKI